MPANKLLENAKTIVSSIAADRKLVLYGFVLLTLHAAGVLLFYRLIPEFDNLPHLWFGVTLSEYSSKAADSMQLQLRLVERSSKRGWAKTTYNQADYLIRVCGFLLIGGLLWEWLEIAYSPLLHIRPDSFFSFPITLRNIDGALDVTVGLLGATLAFFVSKRARDRSAK